MKLSAERNYINWQRLLVSVLKYLDIKTYTEVLLLSASYLYDHFQKGITFIGPQCFCLQAEIGGSSLQVVEMGTRWQCW